MKSRTITSDHVSLDATSLQPARDGLQPKKFVLGNGELALLPPFMSSFSATKGIATSNKGITTSNKKLLVAIWRFFFEKKHMSTVSRFRRSSVRTPKPIAVK